MTQVTGNKNSNYYHLSYEMLWRPEDNGITSLNSEGGREIVTTQKSTEDKNILQQ